MWGEIHILTGIALQKASGDNSLAWPIVASIASHWPLDDLNVDYASVHHGLGTGWRKWAVVSARVGLGLVLAYYLWNHPAYLTCGLLAWLCLDWEWLVSPLLGRHGFGLHERMFPAWLRSEWGILITLVAIIVMMGVVL